MTISPKHALTVTILDRDYRIYCEPEESESLRLSAHYLDKKMRGIRNGGKVVGLERIAVMAALNISHDYLLANSSKEDHIQSVRDEIQSLQQKVDEAVKLNNSLPSVEPLTETEEA